MLILAIIAAGMCIGALAQMAFGQKGRRVNWSVALVAGLVGSFIGGLVISLLAGDGLSIRPSGLIGSFGGAVLVTYVWMRSQKSS